MSRYKIVRIVDPQQNISVALHVQILGNEVYNKAGGKIGCNVAVLLRLLSGASVDGVSLEALQSMLLFGADAQTTAVADDVQEFIEALVAKASD